MKMDLSPPTDPILLSKATMHWLYTQQVLGSRFAFEQYLNNKMLS